VHIRRVKSFLPDKGQVGILSITDKQFGDIEIYFGKKQGTPPIGTAQIELF
jgi:CRISPR-associated protein Cas2